MIRAFSRAHLMPPPWTRPPARKTYAPTLEVLEDRVVPDAVPILVTPPPGATLPYAAQDFTSYNVSQPSSPISVLGNDLNNPGATWNFASLSVVRPPQFGILTLDATTGILLYTQNALP